MADNDIVVVGGIRYRAEDAKRLGLVSDVPPTDEGVTTVTEPEATTGADDTDYSAEATEEPADEAPQDAADARTGRKGSRARNKARRPQRGAHGGADDAE